MIIDLLCLALIALVVWTCARKGIFIVILHVLSYVIAGVFAKISAPELAKYIYDAFLHQRMLDKLGTVLPSGSVGGGVNEVIDAVVQGLPEKVRPIADFLKLIPTESAKNELSGVLTVSQIEAQYVAPIVTKVATFITMVLLFIVISVILRLVSAWINAALFEKREGGVLYTANKVGGGLLGLVKGAIPVAFIGILLILAAPVINNEFLLSQVNGSYLCRFLANLLV